MDVGDCRGLKTTRLHVARDAIKKKKRQRNRNKPLLAHTHVFIFFKARGVEKGVP